MTPLLVLVLAYLACGYALWRWADTCNEVQGKTWEHERWRYVVGVSLFWPYVLFLALWRAFVRRDQH